MADRKGDWIQTYTGKQFWPLDPRPEDIEIADIAHALSNLCRFGGHCKYFYSVAEHSVHAARLVHKYDGNPLLQMTALLHDASEAYFVDIPRPIKKSMPIYKEIENQLQKVIAEKFGLPWPFPDLIHQIDDALLTAEAPQLMGWPPPHPWDASAYGTSTLKASFKVGFWGPIEAEIQFRGHYEMCRMEIVK